MDFFDRHCFLHEIMSFVMLLEYNVLEKRPFMLQSGRHTPRRCLVVDLVAFSILHSPGLSSGFALAVAERLDHEPHEFQRLCLLPQQSEKIK